MVKSASYMRDYRAARRGQLTEEEQAKILHDIMEAYTAVNYQLYQVPAIYKSEYEYNCQRVIYAYEMYRRGINCEAQKKIFPIDEDEFNDLYQHAMKNEEWLSVGSKSRNKTVTNLESQINKWGEGARGAIEVAWDNYNGHVFNFEVFNGEILYIDAQVGKRIDINNYLEKAMPTRTKVARLDNLQPTDLIDEYCIIRK